MRLSILAVLAVLASSLGCRAAVAPSPPVAPTIDAPRDAADAVAQEAVDARVTMLLHVDRLAGFRFSQRLVQLGGWDEVLAQTGVDPLRDVQRAFVAAHASHTGDVALVLSHTAPEDRVTAALLTLQRAWTAAHPPPRPPASPTPSTAPDAGDTPPASADGPTEHRVRLRDLEARIADLLPSRESRMPDPARFPFPAAYIHLANDFAHTDGPVLLAAPHPGLLVVLPPRRAFAAFRMMEAGGLPAPRAGEAMVFRAWDPEASIQNGPLWSPEVRYAEATFTFDATGAATLKFRAVCTSPDAARAEALRMTTQVEDAQSFSVAGTRLRLFDYIEFQAEKDRVKMRTRLLPEDVDWLVAMSMKPLP